MTTNIFQQEPQRLDVEMLMRKVKYQPLVYSVGITPEDWSPQPYFIGERYVVSVSTDPINYKKSLLMDNVMETLTATTQKEHITILPIRVEFVESGLADLNATTIVPQILTDMNIAFDKYNIEALKSVSKKSTTDITWDCAPKLINDICAELAKFPYTQPKTIITSQQAMVHLNSISSQLEVKTWSEELSKALRVHNTSLRICEYMEPIMFIVFEDLLAEYTGMLPTIRRQGFDERKDEYWYHFIMSNSHFVPRAENASIYIELKSFDGKALGSKLVCSK